VETEFNFHLVSFNCWCPGAESGLLTLPVLGETRTETWDSEAGKQCFIVPTQTQWTHIQRLNTENKGVSLSPYVPLQAGYRGNKI
jgi:hypothetical protein